MISKEEFEEYKEIQHSGITNMCDVRTVCSLSGLERETVLEIMKNYSQLREKYGE